MDLLTYGLLTNRVNADTIKASVDEWLDDHPEATTTVQDGAISYQKLDASLKEDIDEVGQLKTALGNTDGALNSALFDIAANIVDLSHITNGYIKDDGTIGTASGYKYTENYISVKPGETYALSGFNSAILATYDAEKVFKGRISVSSSMTMGSNIHFIRISGNGTPSNWKMNIGSTVVGDDYHAPYLGSEVLLPNQIDSTFTQQGKVAGAAETGAVIDALENADAIVNESIDVLVEYSENIADTTHIEDGFIKDDGTIGTGSGYKYTPNYIRVDPGATYSIAGLGSIAVYDSEKTFKDRDIDLSTTKTFDSNICFVRLSSNASPSTWRMNKGATLYDHPYHDPYLGEDVKVIYQANDILASPWAGKTYAAIGDSVTSGFIPRNSEGYPGSNPSYAQLTAQKLGMNFINYGIAGSSLAYISNRDPMCRRYTEMSNDADLITFMGGANDIRNGIQLGTMTDRTDDTYYGALHVLLGGLYKKYIINQGTTIGKTKKIVALTPIKLLQQSSASSSEGEGTLVDLAPWVAAVKEVAAYYSIPVLDMYNLSMINPHLDRTIHGTESGYTGYYNPYITDGTHPTKEGHEIMAEVLTGFLRTLT